MAHDVFISYATEDKPTADALCAALEARHIRCWIAPRDVLPGRDYAEMLIEAIRDAHLMVLVFSSKSNSSTHVMREVERAATRGIPIVPFRIEDVPPCASMEYYISSTHWLDALTPPLERHLQQLANTVQLLLGRAEKITPAEKEPEPPVSPPTAEAAEARMETTTPRVDAPEGRRRWDRRRMVLLASGVGMIVVAAIVIPLVLLPGGGEGNQVANKVDVLFATGQSYYTEGDNVDNSPKTAPTWINTWLHNEDDDTDADVQGESSNSGPVLDLHAGSLVTGADAEYLASGTVPGTQYTWHFPPIAESQAQHGEAELQERSAFQPGFLVERRVSDTVFPSTGGTQHLTLRVTPQEAMQTLEISGTAQVNEHDIARVVNVEMAAEPPEGAQGVHFAHDEHAFWIDVRDPTIGITYEWLVSIDVAPADPSQDVEFMPFVQVQNIVAVINNGQEYGSSLEVVTTLGTWNWRTHGDYLWNWREQRAKVVNLEGYARVR